MPKACACSTKNTWKITMPIEPRVCIGRRVLRRVRETQLQMLEGAMMRGCRARSSEHCQRRRGYISHCVHCGHECCTRVLPHAAFVCKSNATRFIHSQCQMSVSETIHSNCCLVWCSNACEVADTEHPVDCEAAECMGSARYTHDGREQRAQPSSESATTRASGAAMAVEENRHL